MEGGSDLLSPYNHEPPLEACPSDPKVPLPPAHLYVLHVLTCLAVPARRDGRSFLVTFQRVCGARSAFFVDGGRMFFLGNIKCAFYLPLPLLLFHLKLLTLNAYYPKESDATYSLWRTGLCVITGDQPGGSVVMAVTGQTSALLWGRKCQYQQLGGKAFF